MKNTANSTSKSESADRAYDRRGFLKSVGGASVAGAAVAVGAAAPAQAAETEDEKRKSRYQETEHVKAFYRTNRY